MDFVLIDIVVNTRPEFVPYAMLYLGQDETRWTVVNDMALGL